MADSIENFQVRVTVRETAKSRKADARDAEPFLDDISLSWQEKMYGPSDIIDYMRNKSKSTSSVSRRMTRNKLGNMASNDKVKSPEELLQRTMVYTQTDRDNYLPMNEPLLLQPQWAEPYTGKASGTHRTPYEGNEGEDVNDAEEGDLDLIPDALEPGFRAKKIAERFRREHQFKTMHICLATDVNPDQLISQKDSLASFEEHVLCTIRLYSSGLLEVNPGFSCPVEEKVTANGLPASRSLFMHNETVKAGVTKGFQLETFRVRTKFGGEFEYSLQNMNELSSPMELEQAIRSTPMRPRPPDVVWKQDPPPSGFSHTMTYYMNIESGQRFDSDRMFVAYQFKLPNGWVLRTGNLGDGMAEKDIKEIGGGDLLDDDGFKDGEDAEGMLQGITQVAQAAGTSMLRGSRLYGNSYLEGLDGPTRIILGWCYLFVTVLSIILGPTYPLWVGPAFALVFIIGPGAPVPDMVTVLRPKKGEISRAEQPVRHDTHSVVTFGHLVNVSFDVSEEASHREESPKVIFQVYHVGSFGRVSVEGYGYLDMPSGSGTCTHEVPTWRPEGTISQQLEEFFVGGMNTLFDPAYVTAGFRSSANAGKAINRFGVKTVGSGELKVVTNTVFCDPQIPVMVEAQEEDSKTQNVQRTVDQILTEFRSSRASASASADLSRAASGGGGASAKGSLADAIKATREASDAANKMAAERARSRRDASETGRSGVDSDKAGTEQEPLISTWGSDGD